jgi:hypothetical protein
MNSKNNIFIDIITSFRGTQQLKQAKTAFEELTGVVKGFTAAYTVEKILSDSIAAFKAETSAIAGLNVALQNTGTSFTALQPVFEKQVNSMAQLGFKSQDTFGALTKLTTSLQNPAKALDVLATTADLARYKNQDLATTADQVGKAIAGNSRAFADLGLKVDKNLSPMNAFNKLMEQAKQRAGGAALAYSKTLGGALDVASAKADAAKAKLGEALAPGIEKLASFASTVVAPIFGFLSNHLTEVGAMATAILGVAAAVKTLGIVSAIAAGEMALNPIFAGAAAVGLIAGILLQKSPSAPVKKLDFSKVTASTSKIDFSKVQPLGATGGKIDFSKVTNQQAQQKKTLATNQAKDPVLKSKIDDSKKALTAEQILAQYEKQWNAKALADAKALSAQKAQQLKLDQASSLLKRSQSVFDLQQIEVTAALQNKSLDANETLRLQMIQTQDQLAAAIQDQNIPLVEQLSAKLENQTGIFAAMQHIDPYQMLVTGADSASAAILKAYNAQLLLNQALAAQPGANSGTGSFTPGTFLTPSLTPGYEVNPTTGLATNGGGLGLVVNLNVAGSVLTNQELKDYMVQALVNSTASGTQGTYDRNKLGAW